jgi:oxygen-independent coproporphyrinogen-3 oxidase
MAPVGSRNARSRPGRVRRDNGGLAFGVYVHIPFCASRCDYCDFATWTDRGHLVDDYVDACVADLARHRAQGTAPASSVFFGGGTPSLIPATALVRILDAIDREPGAEVTVECNPDAFDAEKARVYVEHGVDRVSFGVQSMVPHVLAALGRTHDPDNVRRSVETAREAGIRRVNLDLIYGAAGESVDDWEASVRGALELAPEHVSAYALTVEPGTALGRAVAAGRAPEPDDDDQARKYEIADGLLDEAGLHWYEISNWSRPGEECRHNLLYWRGGEYLGIGCAAHGHTSGRRWWTVRTPDRYLEQVWAGCAPEAGAEELASRERAEEAFTLAIRTREGVRTAPAARSVVGVLEDAGLLEVTGDRVVLTRRGRLVGSDLTARLLLAGAAVVPSAAGTR